MLTILPIIDITIGILNIIALIGLANSFIELVDTFFSEYIIKSRNNQ